MDGIFLLINTVGGDVSCGLAIAEMIASLSFPTVSLVIGGSHSIGVPLAVCTDHSFIVPTGTMMIHPVRMSGMVIGTQQTYEYFEMIQDRILNFVSSHARIPYDRLKSLMHNTENARKGSGNRPCRRRSGKGRADRPSGRHVGCAGLPVPPGGGT